MTKGIVRQLLDGSAAIDQMKKEIDLIIQMLIGYLNQADLVRHEKEEGFTENLELHFERGSKRWIVCRIVNTDALGIELEIRASDGCRTVYYSQWGKPNAPKAADIQGIHRSLPILVEGLAQRYPQLQTAWAPLLKADS